MKTGLDDGPLLPLPQQIARACHKIDKLSRTDVHRINWMEARKYLQIGIGFDGKRFTSDVYLGPREIYKGRNLRDAIDKAMDAQLEAR